MGVHISSRLLLLIIILFVASTISPISLTLLFSHKRSPRPPVLNTLLLSDHHRNQSIIDLLSLPFAWNHLYFSPFPPLKLLKIALFVKKWPHQSLAGGLERHALTLHLMLAKRGHELHIFTTNSSLKYSDVKNLHVHFSHPTPAGLLNQPVAWEQFQKENASRRPFDVVHTESVGLFHSRAANISNLVASWHGIAYETIHSDIVQDLVRSPDEPRQLTITERVPKVIEEVKFFRKYAHHVATSDHVGDVLRRVYMIPENRVHVILNGVDEEIYEPNVGRGVEFRGKFGVPKNATLVIGMAGRLVKDKGHPIMFEALKQLFQEDDSFRSGVYILVAGNGPWGARYRELGSNLLVLGPLEQTQLANFYNAQDVFVNPTLRAQGLDHTFLEAMLSGVPLMGTRFASIIGSIITGPEIGYTFLPTVESLKASLIKMKSDGRDVLRSKGEFARQRAMQLFTATKMAAAYERLFLCISTKFTNTNSGQDLDGFCTYTLNDHHPMQTQILHNIGCHF